MQHGHHLGRVQHGAAAHRDNGLAALGTDEGLARLHLVPGWIGQHRVKNRELHSLLVQGGLDLVQQPRAVEELVCHQHHLVETQHRYLLAKRHRGIGTLEYDRGVAGQQAHQPGDDDGPELEVQYFHGGSSGKGKKQGAIIGCRT